MAAFQDRVSPKILKRYQFAATTFLKFLGPDSEGRLLESVTESEIRRFSTKLKSEGRCGSTINRIIRADLGNAFHRAVNLGKLKFNPISAVDPEKDSDKLPRVPFTPEQVSRVIAACRGTDWEGAVRFGYTTGARLQDVAHLTWDKIDMEVGVVMFNQLKTGQQTPVAIHPDFESWLIQQRASDDPKAFVFPALANRPSGGRRGLTSEFNGIVERSGIDAGLIRERKGESGKTRKNLTFHGLRHTAASVVFNAAAVKAVARSITGHAERGSIDKYLHVDIKSLKSATALIPRLPS